MRWIARGEWSRLVLASQAHVSRRLATLGGSVLVPRGQSSAQAPPAGGAPPHRIDVHHHFAPPQWVAAVSSRELLQPRTRDWARAKSIDNMDRGGVETAIVSITNPGLWFGDNDETCRLARECNEYAAKLIQDYPGRFGMFAFSHGGGTMPFLTGRFLRQ